MVTFENVWTVTYETSSLNQKMRKFNMFITAVCFLFLIKLRWPKNKSVWLLCRLIEFFLTEELSVVKFRLHSENNNVK